jgi:hypothetical protein
MAAKSGIADGPSTMKFAQFARGGLPSRLLVGETAGGRGQGAALLGQCLQQVRTLTREGRRLAVHGILVHGVVHGLGLRVSVPSFGTTLEVM